MAFQPDDAVTVAVGTVIAAVVWLVLLRWTRRRMRQVTERALREQRFG